MYDILITNGRVIDGAGNYDPEKMRADVKKIVETQVALMGGEIPYRDYTFILHLRANTGGGLEHLNSTALGYQRFGFGPEPKDGCEGVHSDICACIHESLARSQQLLNELPRTRLQFACVHKCGQQRVVRSRAEEIAHSRAH